MFFDTNPTRYDLTWEMLGFPIRIHPSFWILCCVLGLRAMDLRYLVVLTVAVTISVLLHEFGHAFTSRCFGGCGQRIVLDGFGGTTSNATARGFWPQILVFCAGCLAGFGLCLLAFVVWRSQPKAIGLSGQAFLACLVMINLWWGLINLLPVYPLDGGQISMALFTRRHPYRGAERALRLSLGVAVVCAVLGLFAGQYALAALFGILGYSNYQQLHSGATPGAWR